MFRLSSCFNEWTKFTLQCARRKWHLTESWEIAMHTTVKLIHPICLIDEKKIFFSLPQAKHHQCFFSFHKKVSKSTGRKEQCTHWQLNKGRWIALNKHQTARTKHEMFQSFIDLIGLNLTHTKALQLRDLFTPEISSSSVHVANSSEDTHNCLSLTES